MNLLSEQLNLDFSIDLAQDQPLSKAVQVTVLTDYLGKPNCSIENISGRQIFIYTNAVGVKIAIFHAAITYLGGNGQHPVFKKRIQLKNWYKEITLECINKLNYQVKYIGIYHYKGFHIFADFEKDTYLAKKMNNSAAHVYINDLYQGQLNGIFQKIDRNGNKIITINSDKFSSYLNDTITQKNVLFDFFNTFNSEFPFSEWILAIDAIKEMHDGNWSQWRQSEWPGWFLEFRINKYIAEHGYHNVIKYVGNSYKGKMDFDLFFNYGNFMGDLKASTLSNDEIPLNDQQNFTDCINKFGKFWYIIYEHLTIKDSNFAELFPATKARTSYINESYGNADLEYDELSYYKRMKHSVNFVRMSIIELNQVNFHHALSEFAQGKQPDGKSRKLKFKMKKSTVDNYVVYRFTTIQK